MSRTWITAGSSEQAWEKFREKFKKLFPDDDRELKLLSVPFDMASEAMHSSPKGVAHYRSDGTDKINEFDIRSDAVFMVYFMIAVDCHLTILGVFQRILMPFTRDTKEWEQRLFDAKVAFTAKHTQWMPLVKTAIIEPTP